MDTGPDRDFTHFNRVHVLGGKEQNRQLKELKKSVPVRKALPHKANDQGSGYN